MSNEQLMREALSLAETAMARGEVPIAALIVLDGKVIGRGWNKLNATKDRTLHAEIAAFHDAAGKYPVDTKSLTLVSTLEPCVMCFGAALIGGVADIVYALPAPADGGFRRVSKPESPEANWPKVVGDVLKSDSHTLFDRWLKDHPEAGPQRDFVEQLLASQ